MHWDCAVYNLLFKPLELGQLELLPLMYIFSTLLSFSVKVLREYLIDFFFFKSTHLSASRLLLVGEKHFMKNCLSTFDIRKESAVGAGCEANSAYSDAFALLSRQSRTEQERSDCSPGPENRSQVLTFFFEEGHKLFQDGEHRPTSSLSLRKAGGVLEIPRSQTATIIWDE